MKSKEDQDKASQQLIDLLKPLLVLVRKDIVKN